MAFFGLNKGSCKNKIYVPHNFKRRLQMSERGLFTIFSCFLSVEKSEILLYCAYVAPILCLLCVNILLSESEGHRIKHPDRTLLRNLRFSKFRRSVLQISEKCPTKFGEVSYKFRRSVLTRQEETSN